MKFQEYINEIFTSPVKVDFDEKSYDYSATFNVGKYTFQFTADMEDEDSSELFFSQVIGKHEYEWDKSALDDPKLAIKVFSTIVDLTKRFIKEENPKYIHFSAKSEESSRVKLYDKFAKWLKKLGYTLIKRKFDRDIIHWKFKRIKK